MKMIMACLILAASQAQAASSYLGTSNQDVTVTGSLPAGTNNIGDVDVLSLPALPTGANKIGDVGLKDSGGHELDVQPDGSINVNSVVVPSTNSVRGKNGNVVTSQTVGSNDALHVFDLNKPDISGKVMVYKSSDNMVVGQSLTLTSLGKSVDLQAIVNDCTFKINGGDDINVAKNTAESFDFAYTLSNPSVSLEAKSGGATCKVRIVGVN